MSAVVHIVLVQDDPGEDRAIVRALASAGWRVSEVPSTAACLAALRDGHDSVVLLDLRSPDTERRELLARLATEHPETPAVVVTGVDDVAVATDVMRRGAWDYVVKRPDASHLVALPLVVARALERRGLVRDRDRYRDEMEALAIALRGTTDGVTILDAGGRIIFANRALAEAWQQPESAIVGRLLADFVRPADDGTALSDVLAAMADRGRWSGMLHPLESLPGVWDVTLTPIRCPESAPAAQPAGTRAMVGIFRDVSEKHALEQMRADFLSMITHDIKVPLTVILGYTEMLTDPEPPPGEIPPDIVARIRESGETIHGLVCNFLDLSRIEAGRMTLDPRPVDLGELVGHAVEHYGSSARRKGIALDFVTAPLPPVLADEPHLERVIANLLGNAIKYTPSGGRISVTTGEEGDRVALAFRDTGRGIPADELPHLFEKYRRVREATRTEGTGLGLFIAKTIVMAHGGDIRVESAPGAGSTFTILLPAAASGRAAARARR